ncbi:TFIIH subunit [Heterostelium album PN500]|uniref:General transcription factor IIH subunit n=1 Tax=Heterostelium pallidum (strain ATCC 26659 / Pp 5 / PN500) TaxID=670386 RepID=D3AXK7_HETP5|nr:TFIIH subunit [Heterostelium album PN500]EFA86276.1 TFIIH subunit [Heterostelium album PN500]|eukprot:XP_020438381.1 TFIIH subunit [Heterostelium album PN500]
MIYFTKEMMIGRRRRGNNKDDGYNLDEDQDPDHVLQLNDQGTNKYKWESQFERTWDDIEEDESGLRPSLQEERIMRTRRQRIDAQRVRRGMQRHICLIVDLSKTLASQDMKPSRHQCLLNSSESFIKEFFDQNPISQISLIVTKNSKAEKLTELNGNPNRHITALKNTSAMEGDPSIQNSLEVAISTLSHVPKYGSREIIVIYSSLTTCDPGDLTKTIEILKNEQIRVSFIHMAAELFICKHISEQTHGTMKVVLNEEHFNECLMLHCQPPPTFGKTEAALVEMGFPQQHTSSIPMMCMCHEQLRYVGYTCPRCSSKFCELPTDCQICNLSLVSSPHLARSYHHLFQVPLFTEINWRELKTEISCFGCLTVPKSSSLFFGCPRCKQSFCFECDQFIHESLHNCPGCENNLNTNENDVNNNSNHSQNGNDHGSDQPISQ